MLKCAGRGFDSRRLHRLMVMISLYELAGSRGKRYVGITKDLTRRLREHRSGKTKAGQLIGEFRVLHVETYPDYATARVREKFLKSGQGRKWLATLQHQTRPAEGG